MFTSNIVIYSTPRCPLKVRVVNITTKVPYVSTPFLGKKKFCYDSSFLATCCMKFPGVTLCHE